MRARTTVFVALLLGVFISMACGGDDEPSGQGNAAPTATAAQAAASPTTGAQAGASPTAPSAAASPGAARPVMLTQAQLSSIAITQPEVAALFGTAPFGQTQTNVGDIRTAFSSSPQLGDFLVSQQVAGAYNAWTAMGQCLVCAVQVPVFYFPTEAAATAAYQRVEEVNRMIFQGVNQLGTVGQYWDQSFCQLGNFTSAAGQTLRWIFCAMREGNAVITAAIGGFNFDANMVVTNIRTYATRVENYLKTQFP
jgi:hypothetical protein